MEKLILKKEDFLEHKFNALLASGNGRRLWATVEMYEDLHVSSDLLSKTVFKVENLKKNSHIEIETENFEEAMEKFNSL